LLTKGVGKLTDISSENCEAHDGTDALEIEIKKSEKYTDP